MRPESLYATPNALAEHYGRFRVAERLLLTGHSHQAWPDRAFDGQRLAWEDAAHWVDDKWSRASEKAERVRRGFAALLDDPDGDYALEANVHSLLARFLSALPLTRRPRLVTTDGEFHSVRRQLERLAEEGVEVVRVPASPARDVGERLADEIDDRTSAVISSTVFFLDAHLAGGLQATAEACRRAGAHLLLDAYHQVNVVPLSLTAAGLGDAFVMGGGYKYCQLGEGNCFLRLPPGCELRPVITGWFAEFDLLEASAGPGQVRYPVGAGRFAGSTYEPTSHYRAAEVFDFFVEMGLDVDLLRSVSLHQLEVLRRAFDALDLDPAVIDRDRRTPAEEVGGFLALVAPEATRISRLLRSAGVFTDSRGDVLRLGPAPYLADSQLEDAVAALGQVVHDLDPR